MQNSELLNSTSEKFFPQSLAVLNCLFGGSYFNSMHELAKEYPRTVMCYSLNILSRTEAASSWVVLLNIHHCNCTFSLFRMALIKDCLLPFVIKCMSCCLSQMLFDHHYNLLKEPICLIINMYPAPSVDCI